MGTPAATADSYIELARVRESDSNGALTKRNRSTKDASDGEAQTSVDGYP